MADAGFGTSPTILPNMFAPPGQALEGYNRGLERNQQRQFEIDYRLRKDEELDQWKKLSLIQELTDLSKHKTGSDVADAIGHQMMSGIYQKYTQAAKNLSPVELQARIQKDMSGIIGGMDATKAELIEADKQMSAIKQLYPELNHAQLYDDYRKDIVSRRLNDGVNDFRSPMEIQQSRFDFNNPETLAPYVAGDKGLRDYFSNPQGVDDTFVFKGSNYANTKYKGKVLPWRKPNYDPSALKEGFLPSKAGEPKLLFKSTTIPSDAMPSSKGQPFEVIDEEVFRNSGLTGMGKLQLVSATKKKFPGYDNFNQEEKDLAQRNVFLEYAKNNDKTDFYPVDRSNPSAAMVKVWTGGSGSGSGGTGTNVNDIYNRIESKVNNDDARGFGTRFTALDADEKSVIKGFVGTNIEDNEIFIKKKPDGRIGIYRTSEDGKTIVSDKTIITTLPKVGTNLKVQPDVKAKREVVGQGEVAPPKANPTKQKKYKGLDAKGNPIFE